jgi:hypothetical protein
MVVEPARSTGHVSRVAITNSREDLTSARSRSPDVPIPKNVSSGLQNQKKSVTKINIGAGLAPDALIAEVDKHSRSDSVELQRPPSNIDDSQPTNKPESSQQIVSKNVENNNVITKSKGRSVSTSSGGVEYEPANPLSGSLHALVDKRNSTSSSTTTSVSKTSSANLSGSYHHLHHLSQVIHHKTVIMNSNLSVENVYTVQYERFEYDARNITEIFSKK